MADEPVPRGGLLLNGSRQVARQAIEVMAQGFQVVGVDLQSAPEGTYAVHNPDKPSSPLVVLRRSERFDSFNMHLREGNQHLKYSVLKYLLDDESPEIFKTGITTHIDDEFQQTESDSDIDGRAPSAGEVANFVIPLANEIKSRSLRIYEPTQTS